MATSAEAASDGRFSASSPPTRSRPLPRRGRFIARPLVATMATAALLLFVAALYLIALHVSLEPLPQSTDDLDHRDGLYFAIHGFFLLIACAGGFSLGKWINGLGFAFAVLLLASISTVMVATQLASYELACRGHNDLVRHWQC